MSKAIKNTAVLVIICAVMAVSLALTNYLTEPIIKEKENAATNAALLEIMPNGGGFEDLDISKYTLPSTVTEVYKAKNGGYVVKLTTTGYSSGFVVLIGVDKDRVITGAQCLASTETLGYEKTYGANFVGKNSEELDSVDTISGATKTTAAYKNAAKDAINTAIILDGGSVDLRTEEEILNDNLSAALPAAEGKFTKLFLVEVLTGIDAVYNADNGTGAVYVIGEQFVATDSEGTVISETSQETASAVTAAANVIKASTSEDLILSDYTGLPSQLISAKVTASGNYDITIKAAGYGIQGGDEYHAASGEYIIVRVSISENGQIIDCFTVSQAETDGVGSPCAEQWFYGQFVGKTQSNYSDIDAINGATITTDGYKKAILRAFQSVEIFEGGAE